MTVRLLAGEARRLYNPAVVAASYRTRVLHSEDHLLAVQDSKLGSPGPRFRILSVLEQRELSEPPTRCRWSGCAGPGASSTGFRDQVDRLDDVYTTHATFGVPLPRARAL